MDVLAQQAAVRAMRGSPAAARLMDTLARGVESTQAVILGDSTGLVGTTPWPLQMAQRLAAMFPAYTVNYRLWNATNQNYDAVPTASSSQVVQTGTGTGNGGGPYVLDIYNGSVSGSVVTYPLSTVTRFAAMIPVTPALFIVNYAHNSSTATTGYRYTHYQLVRAIEQGYRQAGIIQIAQNPRGVGDSEKQNHLIRCSMVAQLAATEGHGLVNVTRRFLADPSYTANLMNNDLIHPKDAGVAVWVSELMAHFNASTSITPRHSLARPTQLWVPAQQFAAHTGSPTLAVVNSQWNAWAMPISADTEVVASIQLPTHWSHFDFHLFWSAAAGTGYTGGVNDTTRWRTRTQTQSIGLTSIQYNPKASAAPGGWSFNQGANVSCGAANIGGTYPTFIAQLGTQFAIANNVYGFRVGRFATDAADNLGATAYFLGVMFERCG